MCSWTHTLVAKILPVVAPKLTLRVGLERQLEKSSWGAVKKSSAQQPLALVCTTAEYCDPAWCRNKHTPSIDKLINDALRMVTGCLRRTPTKSLPALAKRKISGSPIKTSHDVFR